MEIESHDQQARLLNIAFLEPSSTNPRHKFDQKWLDELSASIAKQGVMQSIIARPHPTKSGWFEIVAGERRWRASKMAGLTVIPARVRELSDEQVLDIQMIENVQRQDLHPMEEGHGYARLIREFKHTVDELATRTGKSRSTIYQRMQLLNLCPAVQKIFLESDKLSESIALLISRVPTKLQEQCATEILKPRHDDEPMTLKRAKEHIEHDYMLRLGEAPFKTSSPTLVPAAGSCRDCPKRTGNQPELFGDIKGADICTDPLCFESKRKAHLALLQQAEKDGGRKVITGKEAEKLKPHNYSTMQGFVALDDRCFDDNGMRTYREILGKSADEVSAILDDPHSRRLVDIVPVDKVKAILKAKGVDKKARPVRGTTAAEKKTKFERTVRAEALRQLHEHRAKLTITPGNAAIIAGAYFREVWHEKQKMIVKLWGWSSWKASEKLTPADAMAAIVELAAVESCILQPFGSQPPKTLMLICKQVGIDVDKIRRTMAALKKKPAKKKAAKKAKPKKSK